MTGGAESEDRTRGGGITQRHWGEGEGKPGTEL